MRSLLLVAALIGPAATASAQGLGGSLGGAAPVPPSQHPARPGGFYPPLRHGYFYHPYWSSYYPQVQYVPVPVPVLVPVAPATDAKPPLGVMRPVVPGWGVIPHDGVPREVTPLRNVAPAGGVMRPVGPAAIPVEADDSTVPPSERPYNLAKTAPHLLPKR